MKVDICVCTCNRPESLAGLLAAVRNIDLGSLECVEIIVVDNAPDSAEKVCREAQDLPIDLHYVPEPRRGRAFARNTAIAEALNRGADYVAFLDDDDTPEPDWLRRLVDKQQSSDADFVFGAWRQGRTDNAPSWLRKTGAFENPEFGALGKYGIPRHAGTCNVLIGRRFLTTFAKPYFDPAFLTGEDKDFFIRASLAGATMALSEDSMINRGHGDRLSSREAWRRGFDNGCGRAAMILKHSPPAEVRRKRWNAAIKFASRLLLAPLYLLHRDKFMRNVYSIVRGAGLLYTFASTRQTRRADAGSQ